jgi:hypothetical protein
LRRIVVIGSDGIVSLAALRWLADQDAAFVMSIEAVLFLQQPVRFAHLMLASDAHKLLLNSREQLCKYLGN